MFEENLFGENPDPGDAERIRDLGPEMLRFAYQLKSDHFDPM